MDLLTRLHNHRATMAPHQKERHAGKLLLEAIAEIERLRQYVSELERRPTRAANIRET